jgi:PBSX family phage terminase large subunit
VAEGGKRGGKNVVSTTAFCIKLETHPDRLHLIAGVTTATAKLNILDCDGYGLINYFEGRCREGKYKDRVCLYVQTAVGEKVILISGGGKEGTQNLIKGNTYGMAYITEANECVANFINEVFDRTLSSSDRAVFHDLNPKAPKHWYYTDILDYHKDMQAADPTYGYNYGHFTIADNMSISDEKLRRAIKTRDKNSVWYKRDIEGKRIAAEGLCYKTFADNPEAFIIDEEPKVIFSTIGIDFGESKSAEAFNCTGFMPGLASVVTLDEEYTKKEITPLQEQELLIKFVKRQIAAGRRVTEIYADSEAQTRIRGCRDALAKAGIGIRITNAIKKPISDRIDFYDLLMGAGRYKVMRRCKQTIDALSTAQYDDKKYEDVRLDDGTTNIDSLDAQEYSTERYQKQIIDMIMLGGQNG